MSNRSFANVMKTYQAKMSAIKEEDQVSDIDSHKKMNN